jgi:hypothetical protein
MARRLLDSHCAYADRGTNMTKRVQLTDQAIRLAHEWESLPKKERESVAREIAALARYWNQAAEERERFQRFMKIGTKQWRSESGSSGS